jgi:hypothetical protein
MTLWLMRIACWIRKATNTHSENVMFFYFPLQHLLHERASMLRYTYIVCLVFFKWLGLFLSDVICYVCLTSIIFWLIKRVMDSVFCYRVYYVNTAFEGYVFYGTICTSFISCRRPRVFVSLIKMVIVFLSLFLSFLHFCKSHRLSPSRLGQNASTRFTYMALLSNAVTSCHDHTAMPCIGLE